MTPVLYVGNKNYSSWSLRPWLALKWAGIAFDERLIPLGGHGYGKSEIPEVRAVSPSGRVPALGLGPHVVWDSLAIGEWAAENAKTAILPVDPIARAVCRSVTSEMHSSFAAVRRDLGMNIRRRTTPRDWPEDTRRDLARIEEVWAWSRSRYGVGGPFLFGTRTLADAFFAPVATRMRTYGVSLAPPSQAYVDAILADDAFREWETAAIAETWTIPETDAL
jgi:glutathione S-transferase